MVICDLMRRRGVKPAVLVCAARKEWVMRHSDTRHPHHQFGSAQGPSDRVEDIYRFGAFVLAVAIGLWDSRWVIPFICVGTIAFYVNFRRDELGSFLGMALCLGVTCLAYMHAVGSASVAQGQAQAAYRTCQRIGATPGLTPDLQQQLDQLCDQQIARIAFPTNAGGAE